MLRPQISSPLRRVLFSSSSACRICQRQARRGQFPLQLQSQQRQFTRATILRLPETTSKEEAKDEVPEFVPKPLGRPIGFPHPPKAGQHIVAEKKVYTGATMSERNLQRREDIVEKWSQNYFRDFKNIRKYRKGKTFLANPKIFRRDVSLYFPNFHGDTLKENDTDTTPVLKGKISVVNVYSSKWGESQVQTFTGNKENPRLAELLKDNQEVAQMVDINIEENIMKAWIIALFKSYLKRRKRTEDWGKYFMVRKGVSDRVRETIGLLNGRVGYVYLLDDKCRIRWAGSGDAEGTEKDDLTRGLERLLQEPRAPKRQLKGSS